MADVNWTGLDEASRNYLEDRMILRDVMDSSRQRDLLDHIDRVIEGALEDGTKD